MGEKKPLSLGGHSGYKKVTLKLGGAHSKNLKKPMSYRIIDLDLVKGFVFLYPVPFNRWKAL